MIGAVEKPGMYELVGRRTLLQMISAAGGFTEKAGNQLFVLREGRSGITASIEIDLEDLLINGNQKLNIPMQVNDVINVPVDKMIHIYVFGEVKQPGALAVKVSDKVTLLQASRRDDRGCLQIKGDDKKKRQQRQRDKDDRQSEGYH